MLILQTPVFHGKFVAMLLALFAQQMGNRERTGGRERGAWGRGRGESMIVLGRGELTCF